MESPLLGNKWGPRGSTFFDGTVTRAIHISAEYSSVSRNLAMSASSWGRIFHEQIPVIQISSAILAFARPQRAESNMVPVTFETEDVLVSCLGVVLFF